MECSSSSGRGRDQFNGKKLDFRGMQVDYYTEGSKGDRRIDRTKGGKNHPSRGK